MQIKHFLSRVGGGGGDVKITNPNTNPNPNFNPNHKKEEKTG